MKKTYQAPLAEVTRFEAEDILGSSFVIDAPGNGAPAIEGVEIPLFQ